MAVARTSQFSRDEITSLNWGLHAAIQKVMKFVKIGGRERATQAKLALQIIKILTSGLVPSATIYFFESEKASVPQCARGRYYSALEKSRRVLPSGIM